VAQTKLILPDEPWAKDIYGYDVHVTHKDFLSVMSTNNLVIEARVCIEGSTILAGLPFGSVPGSTMADKRTHILQCPYDSLVAAITSKSGFIYKMTVDNHLLVMPSGYMVIEVSQGARVLRWGMSGDERDTNRVKSMIQSQCDSFPEYNNASCALGQFNSWLDSNA
jgi:hypothetical protein